MQNGVHVGQNVECETASLRYWHFFHCFRRVVILINKLILDPSVKHLNDSPIVKSKGKFEEDLIGVAAKVNRVKFVVNGRESSRTLLLNHLIKGCKFLLFPFYRLYVPHSFPFIMFSHQAFSDLRRFQRKSLFEKVSHSLYTLIPFKRLCVQKVNSC